MNVSPVKSVNRLEPSLAENTSIKMIGLGGVGSITARYLSIFLASLNQPMRLVMIDGDHFEPSNATRMIFSEHGNKAVVTRADLLSRFADSSVTLVAIPEYITIENIERLIRSGDIVILAVDNHSTRKLINDHCARLEDICLISGGNDGIGPDNADHVTRGTYGNCQIFIRRAGQDRSPSLARYHPEIREPEDKNPAELSCTEILQSVPQILFANLAVASAILNAFWLYSCGALHYSEIAFDIADGRMLPVAIPAPDLRSPREQTVQGYHS